MRIRTPSSTKTSSQMLPKRLIVGFVALVSTAVIGVTSFAAASPAGKPSKDQCSAAGYSNYGQCVKGWAQSKPSSGYGGGNGNSVETNLNIEVGDDSDGNVFNIVFNYIFG